MRKSNQWAEMVERSDSVEEYRTSIKKIISEIEQMNTAVDQEELYQFLINELGIRENLFSRADTNHNLELSKERTIIKLRKIQMKSKETSAATEIHRILMNFPAYCRFLFQDKIHGKCNDLLKEHLPEIMVKNEYDIQHLL